MAQGTGLGLAMVKQLAELHGGTVAVASAVGEGARFAVWLPLRAVADTLPGASLHVDATAIEDDVCKERFALVIEDDSARAMLEVRLNLALERLQLT